MREILINNQIVSVYGRYTDYTTEAIASTQFKNWVDSIDPEFTVREIYVQSVDFSSKNRLERKVLFVKLKVDVVDAEGRPVPGIVFLRGGAIAVLVIIECEGHEYTVLTSQARFPVGSKAFCEIPAGMLDGDGNFAGKAIKELEEETGLKIEKETLVDLTELVYGVDIDRGVFSSPGLTDEFLRIFLHRVKFSREELRDLNGMLAGAAEENEHITLNIVPLHELLYTVRDSKSLSALMLYTSLKAMGRI